MHGKLRRPSQELVLIPVGCMHIQHERPVVFHEFIPGDSSSASKVENLNDIQGSWDHGKDSDLDSMPELEDEIDLDTLEIPV